LSITGIGRAEGNFEAFQEVIGLMAGFFITLEGIEGSGKSSQARALQQFLQQSGYQTFLTREPGDTEIGRIIRELLLNPDYTEMKPRTEILLYAADRAQHVSELVRPALADGKVVISDRYYDSNLAYQGYGRGLDLETVKKINFWAVEELHPDLTILLDLPVQQGLKRARNLALDNLGDRLEREEINFHQRVRQGYLKLAETWPERIKVVDAALSRAEVERNLREIVKERLP